MDRCIDASIKEIVCSLKVYHILSTILHYGLTITQTCGISLTLYAIQFAVSAMHKISFMKNVGAGELEYPEKILDLSPTQHL